MYILNKRTLNEDVILNTSDTSGNLYVELLDDVKTTIKPGQHIEIVDTDDIPDIDLKVTLPKQDITWVVYAV